MNKYQPKNILVTGGAGFIGSHFVRYLLQNYSNIRIINLDKLTYAGSLNNLLDVCDHTDYRFIQGDICDATLVSDILSDYTIDTIVHFAAESHVDQSIESPGKFIHTNIVGTYTLLEAAHQYWIKSRKLLPNECRFHHISTDEVYGTLQEHDSPFTENTPYTPNSPYSASKASSDHIARAYHQTFNLPVTISNCSNNFGSYQHKEKFIPTVIRACLNLAPIPVYGNGRNIRDWLYVVDHCRAIDLILRDGLLGHTYNIGGDNEVNNLALVNMICTMMDEIKPQKNNYAQLITFVKDRPGHDLRYAIDSKKINETLGWKPQKTFSSHLFQTINWYMETHT